MKKFSNVGSMNYSQGNFLERRKYFKISFFQNANVSSWNFFGAEMPLKFMKKMLLVFGLHPNHFKERWQKCVRVLVQAIIFFNIIPEFTNVVWKIRNKSGISAYAVDIIYFSYNLKINVEFLIFVMNFEAVSQVINGICESLQGESEIAAKKVEKRFLMYVKFCVVTLILRYAASMIEELMSSSEAQLMNYNRFFFDTSYPPLYFTLGALGFLSQMWNDFVSMLLLNGYFNICIQIHSIYQRLFAIITKIDDVVTPADTQRILRKVVASQTGISEKVSKLFSCYKWILTVDFMFLIFTMSLVLLIFSSDGNIFKALIFVPPLMFALFLFCVPSEIVASQVRVCNYLLILWKVSHYYWLLVPYGYDR